MLPREAILTVVDPESFPEQQDVGLVGHQAGSASRERTVKISDAATKQYLQRLEGNSEPVIPGDFSPGGKVLVSGSTNDTLQLWDDDSGPNKVKEAEDSLPVKATSRLLPNEQDDNFSTTDTFNTLWSDQERSTDPSSLSYEAAAAMEQVTESPSSMTFFNYQKPVVGFDNRDDDTQSVESMPDDIKSLVESNSGEENYRQAAVNFIVRMFTNDVEVSALYQEATQSIGEAKFVRNHQRLLKRFYLDLLSEGHSPSQALAVRFLRARSKRIQISSGISNLVIPSDNTVREKINVMLKQEKNHLFLLNRLLEERDSGAQTTEETYDDNQADTVSEKSEDSDGDESEAETQEDNALSKLEATAEFLTSGRPFRQYKENLHGFLHPTLKADSFQRRLQRDVAQTDPEQLFLDHSQDEYSDVTDPWPPLQAQAGDTTQMIHNEHSPTDELPRTKPQSLCAPRNFAVRQPEMEAKSLNFLPNLPLLVDMVLQKLPLLASESPIPQGKVRARWTCVRHSASH